MRKKRRKRQIKSQKICCHFRSRIFVKPLAWQKPKNLSNPINKRIYFSRPTKRYKVMDHSHKTRNTTII